MIRKNRKKLLLSVGISTAVVALTKFAYDEADYWIKKKIQEHDRAIRNETWSTAFHAGWDSAEEHYTLYYTDFQYEHVFGHPRP